MPRVMRVIVLVLWVGGVLCAADPSGIWLDVPFIKQEKDGCGAASIAMVMQYWFKQHGQAMDSSADAVAIQRELSSGKDSGKSKDNKDKDRGIRASDMQRYFQQHSFQTFAF